MATVAEMIEWFKTLPPDAEVECGVEESSGYQTYMRMAPVSIEYSDVLDYTSEEDRAKYKSMAGKTLVMLRGD